MQSPRWPGRENEYWRECQFAQAATTKYHSPGDLNNSHLFSHSSRGWKSKIKVLSKVDFF